MRGGGVDGPEEGGGVVAGGAGPVGALDVLLEAAIGPSLAGGGGGTSGTSSGGIVDLDDGVAGVGADNEAEEAGETDAMGPGAGGRGPFEGVVLADPGKITG